MTFALPALLLLIALLPGWLALGRIRHVEGHAACAAPWAQSLGAALLWAAGLNVALIGLWPLSGLGALPADDLLKLLSPEPAVQTGALAALPRHGAVLLAHVATLIVLANLLPWALRRLVVRHRLDRRRAPWSGLLRQPRAPWYYLLSGADFAAGEVPDLIAVSAVIDVAGQPWLYKGVLDEYFVDADGQLDRLLLQQVVRRPLAAAATPSTRPQDRFERLEGDCLVLRYSQASTLQIDYIRLARTTDLPPQLPPVDDLGDAFAPTQPV
jgi:hypothetical protein